MAEKTVEQRIRELYCAEGGEWLVEKGKVKEARLLKEAYHKIMCLKKELSHANNTARHYEAISRQKEKTIAEREKEVEMGEARLKNRMQYLQEFIDYFNK
jgi:urease accessory protein UreF